MFFICLLGLPSSYLIFFITGYPCIVALRRWNRLSVLNLVILGVCSGLIAFNIVMSFWNSLFGAEAFNVSQFYLNSVWGALFGFITSATWGLIAGCRFFKFDASF